jgi:hypothetical protein
MTIVTDQQALETKAASVEKGVDDSVTPDIQDDTVGSVKVDESTSTASGMMKSTKVEGAINPDQTFDEVIVITCHGCKFTRDDGVKISNLNISLLETARTGKTAGVAVITRFGPPNIPAVLKKIDQRAKQTHPGTPVTLKDVYDVVVKHTGNTYHKEEAFFAKDSEFVFLTPTRAAVTAGHFEIHEARLFGTGCKLRHSGIFRLDQDGEVEDITFELGLTPKTKMRYKHPTKNCNENIDDASKKNIQGLIDISEIELAKIIAQNLKLNALQATQATQLLPDQKAWLDKSMKRLKRLSTRYRGDIDFLQYNLLPYGHIESGSHKKRISNMLDEEVVKLSDILNHSYFAGKNQNKKYLVILHVCKVTCDQAAAASASASSQLMPDENDSIQRTRSLLTNTLTRGSFRDGTGITLEPFIEEPSSSKRLAVENVKGGNLNRRKSGSKNKRARAARAARAVYAVTRTKRNRQKKRRGTRNKNNNNNNKNNNTNKSRKNK